jgi:hypothetical protein
MKRFVRCVVKFIRQQNFCLDPIAIKWLIMSIQEKPELARILYWYCNNSITGNPTVDNFATDVIAFMEENKQNHGDLTTPYDFEHDEMQEGLVFALNVYHAAYATWWYSRRELLNENFDREENPERRVRRRNDD